MCLFIYLLIYSFIIFIIIYLFYLSLLYLFYFMALRPYWPPCLAAYNLRADSEWLLSEQRRPWRQNQLALHSRPSGSVTLLWQTKKFIKKMGVHEYYLSKLMRELSCTRWACLFDVCVECHSRTLWILHRFLSSNQNTEPGIPSFKPTRTLISLFLFESN